MWFILKEVARNDLQKWWQFILQPSHFYWCPFDTLLSFESLAPSAVVCDGPLSSFQWYLLHTSIPTSSEDVSEPSSFLLIFRIGGRSIVIMLCNVVTEQTVKTDKELSCFFVIYLKFVSDQTIVIIIII